jgi:hypothetical protein
VLELRGRPGPTRPVPQRCADWKAGDTINRAQILRVVGVRDYDADQFPVLVVRMPDLTLRLVSTLSFGW